MNLKWLGLMFLAALFIVPKIGHAEDIGSFTSQINIMPDSSIEVKESITYDFGTTEHHGIFRDIPYHYQNKGGNYNLSIKVVSVTDDQNVPYPYTVSNTGGQTEIKVGDPNTTTTGIHTYNFDYTVSGAINYFNDHDELYWNVTGNAWQVPIGQATAEVLLPSGISEGIVQKSCFEGAVGSKLACSGISDNSVASGTVTQVAFNQYQLAPTEGLTVVVGFPKGLVHQPTAWEKIVKAISDNWILVLPILTLIGMWYLRRKVGSDAAKMKTIIPEYEAPADLTPTEVGTLLDESADNQDISAEIINLAVKGYIKITRLQEKVLFFDKTDYQLDLLKPADDLSNEFEKQIVKSLFNGLSVVKLSDLKNSFYRDLPAIKKQIYASLVNKGYLSRNPENLRNLYSVLGAVIIFLGVIFGTKLGAYAVIAIAVSGLIVLIFSRFFSYRTVKGVEGRAYILGLKMYLSVAEKDRLKFFNAPEKTPERFEKLLPYAMVLKVEQQWAKQFEGIYNQPPSWYYDPAGGAFNSFLLINSLHSFNSAAGETLASAPRGAGSGGSGFGGGGFSGGGFGGGGGGSW